jgi:hypothetical protein
VKTKNEEKKIDFDEGKKNRESNGQIFFLNPKIDQIAVERT